LDRTNFYPLQDITRNCGGRRVSTHVMTMSILRRASKNDIDDALSIYLRIKLLTAKRQRGREGEGERERERERERRVEKSRRGCVHARPVRESKSGG